MNGGATATLMAGPSGRRSLIVGTLCVAVLLHWTTPAGPHEWHWLHLTAQKLLFAPALMAAAWFGLRETLLVAAAACSAFGLHIAFQWRSQPMAQADQLAELINLFLAAPAAWIFFEAERVSARRLRRAHEETLASMICTLELRERYTAGHSRRVAAYSLLTAEGMGLNDASFLRALEAGALLHDLGKIGVPDSALLKTGRLDDSEWELMRRHPESGAALARGTDALDHAAAIIAAHHERYDGRGYPAGLAGRTIPLGARIVAAADIYDALTTARPYKRAFPHDEATAFLRAQASAALDPEVVNGFLSIPFARLREAALRQGIDLVERA